MCVSSGIVDGGCAIGECGRDDQHGQFVQQLEVVLQTRMKQERTSSDKHESEITTFETEFLCRISVR